MSRGWSALRAERKFDLKDLRGFRGNPMFQSTRLFLYYIELHIGTFENVLLPY